MVQRLPDTSLTIALAAGGRDHFGWGRDRRMIADIFDALNVNTRATGDFKTPPKFPAYPRPDVQEETEAKPVSVKDLYNRLNRR